MPTDHQRKIRELFDAALDLPGAERLAWLEAQRQASPAALDAVRRLLKAARQSDSFLARPALRRLEHKPREGRRIGAYKIVRELDAGGMGVVYLCERDDGIFQRQAALKVIRSDFNTPELIAKFHAERETLAKLDHRNIARILDGGTTEEGLPYFVMDYIEGERIDAFCNGRQATLTQRLNLMRQLCSAVAYLHESHVLHRDLKPSNVLVTAKGVVKLLDFGIAKQMNRDLEATATQLRLMTAGYSSPEQVAMERTVPASDVYSLAAVLYRLLTGRGYLELDGRPERELICAIREDTPLPMSKTVVSPRPADPGFAVPAGIGPWAASLAGDLDRIVAMALRKEPERRYRTASAFAADLRRFQQNEPVAARGNTPVYVMTKFFVRNFAAVAATLLVAASLTVAATFAGLYYRDHRILVILESARGAMLSRMPEAAERAAFVQREARQMATDYGDKLAPMLAHPLAPRHAIARLAGESVGTLNQMLPAAGNDPAAAQAITDAYLAISRLQWSREGRSLNDPAAASATAREAAASLEPMLRHDPDRLRSLYGALRAIQTQATEAAAAAPR